jgi:hypothetical protein
VRDGAQALDDWVGEVHDTVEAAKVKARQIARELAHELETYSRYRVIVIDGAGKTVASIGIVAD